MRSSTLLSVILVLLLLTASGGQAQPPKVYTLAVVPQYTPLQIHNKWHGLVDYLNSHLDFRLQLKVYASFAEFEEAVFSGKVDFAYLNPYQYIEARRKQGYIPLIRDSSQALQGILVVRADSPYHKLADLQGKRLVFPSPNALASSLYMRALLHGVYGLDFESAYVESHSNVYRHVLQGKAAAGGGVIRTLEAQPEGLRDQLRILFTTPKLAPHPIIAHPRVPEAARQQVRQLLLGLSGTPYMEAIQMPLPIVAIYRRDYQPLEQLGLDKYWVDY